LHYKLLVLFGIIYGQSISQKASPLSVSLCPQIYTKVILKRLYDFLESLLLEHLLFSRRIPWTKPSDGIKEHKQLEHWLNGALCIQSILASLMPKDVTWTRKR
jgi:hypothetical protein